MTFHVLHPVFLSWVLGIIWVLVGSFFFGKFEDITTGGSDPSGVSELLFAYLMWVILWPIFLVVKLGRMRGHPPFE